MGSKAHVALVLATSTGGVGQHVRSLAGHLVAAGHQVTVCGPAATEELFRFSATGAQFVPVGITAGINPVADLRAIFALRRAVKNCQVIHAHGYRAGSIAMLARRKTQPLIVTWHNILLAKGLRHSLLAWLEKRVARGAQITLGASEDLVARARELGAVDARFAPVAAPGLPKTSRTREEVRRELGVTGRKLVLSVGRLHPQKAFDVLITAAARWAKQQPRVQVAIAGDGPLKSKLTTLNDQLGARVLFLGRRDDVADLLTACDIAVVTSDWEARQLFAQEALHIGKPLVVTAVGGLPGLVGGGAELIPPHDVDALDKAVTDLLDNPQLAADLAQRGLARAKTWPTEQDTADQLMAIYSEVVERKS